MNTKVLLLLFIFLSCDNVREKKNISIPNLPPPPSYEKISWLKSPKNMVEYDKSLSHQKGFQCDSVIGIDYVGFEGEDFFYPINEKGEFISSIKKKQQLNKKQILKLNSILGNKETYQKPSIVGCYEPRLAFVYYRKNKVIGQTQICLSCAQLHSTAETVEGEYGNLINKKAIQEFNELQKEIGLSSNLR